MHNRIIPQKEREEMIFKFAITSTLAAPIIGLAAFDHPIVNFLFGEWNMAMYILLALTALDILTGIAKGIYDKRLRSRKMSQGMARKLLLWVVVIVGNFIDILMFNGMPIVRTGTVLFYIAMELLSITENLALMDVQIPSFIGKYIEVLKEKGESLDIPEKKVDEIKVKINDEEIKLKTKNKDDDMSL
jgi:toxin secretion/phage lysis holin